MSIFKLTFNIKRKVPVLFMKNVKIIVASHKPYKMPQDEMYIPLFVGAEGKEPIGYQGDNTGENISTLNPFFCELCGLYWAWKNLDADYIGLAHYRRHFSKNVKRNKMDCVLSFEEANELLENYDIILPKERSYYIENLYDHYAHTLYVEPLDKTGEILASKYPEYYEEFKKLRERSSGHMFNMFIMKKQYLDEYCTWLFDILFELTEKIKPEQYEDFHARYPGRISELLLDVWLNTKGYKYTETAVVNMESVNWLKKGFSFILSKFSGKKYEKSF